jgi:hypothetical protein
MIVATRSALLARCKVVAVAAAGTLCFAWKSERDLHFDAPAKLNKNVAFTLAGSECIVFSH